MKGMQMLLLFLSLFLLEETASIRNGYLVQKNYTDNKATLLHGKYYLVTWVGCLVWIYLLSLENDCNSCHVLHPFLALWKQI